MPFVNRVENETFHARSLRYRVVEGATSVQEQRVTAEIDAAVADANKSVSHAESIKKYRLLPHDFSEESGELTPTAGPRPHVAALCRPLHATTQHRT